MTNVPSLQKRIQTQFALLDKTPAKKLITPTSLSTALSLFAPVDDQPFTVDAEIPRLFITASTDAWQRAIHSFLVSIALTECSPLWSGISGYYSSHYSVRAFAHLFGSYVLFNRKKMVELTLEDGAFNCAFLKKRPQDREHQAYWKRILNDNPVKADKFFRVNTGTDSEISQRDRANYADHLSTFYKNFQTLDIDATTNRIERISKIELAEPPLPRMSKFVDIENIQLIAYHRFVKYRRFLDETLDNKSRYWKVGRNPTFSSRFIDFQLTESRQVGGIHSFP